MVSDTQVWANGVDTDETRHDKTNQMSVHPAKTQISLDIRPVWSESLQCAQWVAEDPLFLHADSEDSDQTGRMPRLIWVFAGRTVTLLVLPCRGSDKTAPQLSDLGLHCLPFPLQHLDALLYGKITFF